MFCSSRVVRAMPNMPASVGKAMTGLVAPAALEEADRPLAMALAESVGQCAWVDNDTQLDAVTALSGSGPAYVFYLIESTERAAMTLSISPALGRQLALETCLGAALLAQKSEESISILHHRVTSPSGTTEAAIQVLDRWSTMEAFVLAIQAATNRSQAITAEYQLEIEQEVHE